MKTTLLLAAGLCALFLFGCESDDKNCPTCPPPCPVIDHAIAIDVEPEWIDLGWSLLAAGDTITGVGDTVLVFDAAPACTLRAVESDGLRVLGGAERIFAPAAQDTLRTTLRYGQDSWVQRLQQGGNGPLYDVLGWTGGDVILAGSYQGSRLLQRLDSSGTVVWEVVEPGYDATAYHALVPIDAGAPLGEPAFLAVASGQATRMSWRASDGEALATVIVDTLSLGGIAGGPDTWLMLGTGMSPNRLYTALVEVDMGGEISRRILDGTTNCVGVGVAERVGGGWWVVQTRDVGEDLGHYNIELLAFDPGLNLESIQRIAGGEGGYGLGMIARPDGGMYVNYLDHDIADGDPGTRLTAISAWGDVEWTADLDERGFEACGPIDVDDSGTVTLVGHSADYGEQSFCVRTIRVSAQGDFIDVQRVCSLPERCQLYGGCTLWDDGLLLCGAYGDWQDGWLVRLASPGLGGDSWPDLVGD